MQTSPPGPSVRAIIRHDAGRSGNVSRGRFLGFWTVEDAVVELAVVVTVVELFGLAAPTCE